MKDLEDRNRSDRLTTLTAPLVSPGQSSVTRHRGYQENGIGAKWLWADRHPADHGMKTIWSQSPLPRSIAD